MPNGFGSWGHPLSVVAEAVRDAVWNASTKEITNVNAIRDAVWAAAARTLTHVGVLQAVAAETQRVLLPDEEGTQETWVQAYAARVGYGGIYRCYVDCKASYEGRVEIRKNGSPTVLAFKQTTSTSYTTLGPMDITCLPGDVIELWFRSLASGYNCNVRNFKVCCDYEYMAVPSGNPSPE